MGFRVFGLEGLGFRFRDDAGLRVARLLRAYQIPVSAKRA